MTSEDRNYGNLVAKAQAMTGFQEVGETINPLMKRLRDCIEECAQKEYDRGTRGKYYIHIWIRKDPHAMNILRIFPQCRRTRPSPYQDYDHYLWSIDDGGICKFEWCIPDKGCLKYILDNPTKFDSQYIAMLRRYCEDKLEKIDDYLVKDKIN